MALNRLTRGWCEYYRNTSSPTKIFGNLSHELIWDMTHWLGQKVQAKRPKCDEKVYEGRWLNHDPGYKLCTPGTAQ